MSMASETREKVDAILRAYKGDPEAAHGMEDDLLEAVVRMAATGHPKTQEIALEAIMLLDSDRTRWYA